MDNIDTIIEKLDEILENYEVSGTLGDEDNVARELQSILDMLNEDMEKNGY